MNPTRPAVMRLASERPDWLPVLQAACDSARKAEPYGGEFAGAWVIANLRTQDGQPAWLPGLRLLVGYGLLEKSGESTRGGRRAYYRMPDREGVEAALAELEGRGLVGRRRDQPPSVDPAKAAAIETAAADALRPRTARHRS